MSKSDFIEEFKREAVGQITERGYPVADVSQRLGAKGKTAPQAPKRIQHQNAHRASAPQHIDISK